MKSPLRAVLAVSVVVLLAAAGASVAAAGNEPAIVEIPLQGSADFPQAHGKARFRDEGGGDIQLRVEVEDVSVRCRRLGVFVDGEFVGPMSGPIGHCRLDLDTDDGDVVPEVVSGTHVEVKRIGGVLVVSGTFP